MKVRDLLPIVSPERTLWVEGKDERGIDVGTPGYLNPETLELEIDLLYPAIVKSLGGVNVICVRVKEIENGEQK